MSSGDCGFIRKNLCCNYKDYVSHTKTSFQHSTVSFKFGRVLIPLSSVTQKRMAFVLSLVPLKFSSSVLLRVLLPGTVSIVIIIWRSKYKSIYRFIFVVISIVIMVYK